MSDITNLVERLRQIAESQRMDFDSPNVAATLDDAATTLETLASIGSVVAEEPEWEYGWRSRFATGGQVFQELEWESREQAEQSIRDHQVWEAEDPEESRLVYELVKRSPAVRAGEWVPVTKEGADGG